jgi:pimeloyl-ACP methyl ester carboxylesterase
MSAPSQITCPPLFLVGREGPIVPVAVLQEVSERVAGSVRAAY